MEVRAPRALLDAAARGDHADGKVVKVKPAARPRRRAAAR
jgi:hypothetical protein